MIRFRKGVEVLVGVALIAGLGGVAFAQYQGDEAITKRRGEMVTVGRANGGIGQVLKGDSIPADLLPVIRQEAAKMTASLEVLVDPAVWPEGSTHEAFSGTKAKAEIWTANADFLARMQATLEAARALEAAVESGDLEAMRAAQAALAGTCGGCHNDYRT